MFLSHSQATGNKFSISGSPRLKSRIQPAISQVLHIKRWVGGGREGGGGGYVYTAFSWPCNSLLVSLDILYS